MITLRRYSMATKEDLDDFLERAQNPEAQKKGLRKRISSMELKAGQELSASEITAIFDCLPGLKEKFLKKGNEPQHGS